MTKRYFMYLRRSQDREDKQTESIERQEFELVELVKRLGLNIVGDPIRESRTAKKPGRPLFDKMLSDIERGRADGIVCWHLSRLARNALDGGRVMQGLSDGTIEEIVIPGRTFAGTGDDRLLMALEFGMATKTSDDLAKSAKDGARNLLRKGIWPTRPKVGYLRSPRGKMLVADPLRFPIIRRAWEQKQKGVPVTEIAQRADRAGLRSPESERTGGRSLALAQWYRIFRDPFYCGLMPYDGQIAEGTHPPMVSRAEFDAVQDQFRTPVAPQPRRRLNDFLFRGIFRCGACGGMITGDRTTNRHGSTYTYYRCTRRSLRLPVRCSQPAMPEQKIVSGLGGFLAELTLPDDVAEAAIVRLERRLHGRRIKTDAEQEQIRARLARIESTLTNLRRLCADGAITVDELNSDRGELELERDQLRARLVEIAQPDLVIQPLKKAISLAKTAASAFENGSDEIRRDLLRTIISNPQLKDKNLLIQAQKPFDVFVKHRTVSALVTQLLRYTNPQNRQYRSGSAATQD